MSKKLQTVAGIVRVQVSSGAGGRQGTEDINELASEFSVASQPN